MLLGNLSEPSKSSMSFGKLLGLSKKTDEVMRRVELTKTIKIVHVKTRAGYFIWPRVRAVAEEKITSITMRISIAAAPRKAACLLEKNADARAKADATPAIPNAYLTAGTALIPSFSIKSGLFDGIFYNPCLLTIL